MKRSKYNSFNELPLMLTVQDVADVLGIGLAHAYEVAHRKDFPTITLGSRIIVPRDKFMVWLNRSAEQGNEYARYLLDHREEQRLPDVMLAVTRLLYHMSRIFQDNSLPKSRPGGIQIDRKRLRKLREKKIAQGHKPDDHEEQQPEMTM